MFVTLEATEREVRSLVESIDPAGLTPVDAADAVLALARIVRIATAGACVLSARAGEAYHWRRRHKPDPGAWLAEALGVGVGDGRTLHRASPLLDDCPDTRRLMTAAVIGPLVGAEIAIAKHEARRARARAAAAAAAAAARDAGTCGADAPGSVVVGGRTEEEVEKGLLAMACAPNATPYRVREERERMEAAACDEKERAERARATRFWRPRRYPDGSVGGTYKLPPEVSAAMHAAIDQHAEKLFGRRWRQGIREPRPATSADALVELVTGMATAPPQPSAPPSDAPRPPRRRPARRRRATQARSTDEAGEPRPTADRPPTAGPGARSDTATDAGSSCTTVDGSDDITDHGPPAGAAGTGTTIDDGTDAITGRDEPTETDAEVAGPPAGAQQVLAPKRPEVVVRLSAAALARGFVLPGERCEIAGTGPVPLAAVERLLPHACIDIVVHDGDRVTTVAVAGRRFRKILRIGAPSAAPPHRTRVLLRVELATVRALAGPADATVHLPGTGPVSRPALEQVLSAPIVDVLVRAGVDPHTIESRTRSYRRALLVAHIEEHPVCDDCGNDRWLEVDHIIPLALRGVTRTANLAARCGRCHAAKTKREAARTTRAGRQRRRRRPGQPRGDPVTS